MATLGFKGFSAGSTVNMSASQNSYNDSEEVLAWGTPGRFTIQAYPSDPWIGEVVHFRVIDHELFNVTDIYKELDWAWSADDSGAQYTVGGGGFDNDANSGHGFSWAHAYASAGTYNPSVSVRSVGAESVVTDSISVTVIDPDADTWSKQLYCDFGEVSGTPEFSWAPAEAGNIYHISSIAELQSHGFLSSKVRVVFKDDETFTWNSTQIDLSSPNTRVYIQRSNTGTNRPQIKFSSYLNGCFTAFSDYFRFVVVEVDIVGSYDPSIGDVTVAPCRFFYSSGVAISDCYLSFWRSTQSGNTTPPVGTAGADYDDTNTSTFFIGVSDCNITNWFDYGISNFGSRGITSIVGCRIAQSQLAIQRDQKDGLPGGPDHGPIRIHNVYDGCIENCDLRSNSGWSSLAQGYYIQPCIRVHHEDAGIDIEWRFNIQKNLGVGSTFAQIGSQSASGRTTCQPVGCLITRNQFWGGRQGYGGFINIDVGGVYIYNNVFYRANMYDFALSGAFAIKLDDSAFSGTTVKTNPVYVGFNTIVSDRTSTSGGNEDWSMYYYYLTDAGEWPNVTTEQNVVWVPNHGNGGSFTDYTGLSRADNFKPITGSAAIGAVSSGYPVRDYDGNLRSGNSNVGAHHDSVSSDAGVTAPSNSSLPTIAVLSEFPNEYALTSQGVWSNWTDRETYLQAFDWKLGGTSLGGDVNKRVVVDASALSGNLTVDLIVTNLSGTRVTATSAATAV